MYISFLIPSPVLWPKHHDHQYTMIIVYNVCLTHWVNTDMCMERDFFRIWQELVNKREPQPCDFTPARILHIQNCPAPPDFKVSFKYYSRNYHKCYNNVCTSYIIILDLTYVFFFFQAFSLCCYSALWDFSDALGSAWSWQITLYNWQKEDWLCQAMDILAGRWNTCLRFHSWKMITRSWVAQLCIKEAIANSQTQMALCTVCQIVPGLDMCWLEYSFVVRPEAILPFRNDGRTRVQLWADELPLEQYTD